jgi:hypothetical protein
LNPKKDALNSNGMHEETLARINVSSGTFDDSQIAIMAEYIQIQGTLNNNEINTNITNSPIISGNPVIEDSCIFYISKDNYDPRVEIFRIRFK